MDKIDLAMEYLIQSWSDDIELAFEGEERLSVLIETMTAEERNEYFTVANSYAGLFGRKIYE